MRCEGAELKFFLLNFLITFYLYDDFTSSDVDIQAQLTMNQSRAEEITMREDYGSLSLPHHDEGFGDFDMSEDTPELMREPAPSQSSLFGEPSTSNVFGDRQRKDSIQHPPDDGFGAPLGQDIMGKPFEFSCLVGFVLINHACFWPLQLEDFSKGDYLMSPQCTSISIRMKFLVLLRVLSRCMQIPMMILVVHHL